ncbi:MAG: tandem-95 repeat protein [Porticoccaceae bacterium]|nr:tandem-95 repeat protein [Porticoccaceae bacterium]
MKFFGILRMLFTKPCRYFVSKKTPLKVGIYFFIFLAVLSTLKVNAEEPKLTYVGNWKESYQYPSDGDGHFNNDVDHSKMTNINEKLYYFSVNSRKRVRILLDTSSQADGYLFLFKVESLYTNVDTIGLSTKHTLLTTDDSSGSWGGFYFGMQQHHIIQGFSRDAFIEREIDAGIYMVLPAARNATADPYNLIIMNSDFYHPNGYTLNQRVFDYSTQFTGGFSGSGDEDNVISRMLIATDNNGIQKFEINTMPVHGSATISGSWWHYTPNANYFGNDEFTVTATDNSGSTTDQIISVTVAQVDDPTQFISGMTGLGNSNSLITGTLSATDEDGLTDGSYYSVSAQPTDGNATIDASSGDWEYQPNLNYSGNDEFTVTVTDDAGSTSERNIDITVNNPSQFSGDLDGTGDEDNDISGTLIVTDVEELSGDYLAITANSSNGIATIDASSGDWQYIPSDNYFGTDQFTITVTDDLGGTSAQVISITVNSVDDIAQFAGDLNGAGDEDNVISGTLIVTDVEGLSGDYFAITANSSNGIATIDASSGYWQFTPSDNFFGADTFTVTVTDDLGGTSIQIISVTVNSVDDTTQFSGKTHGIGDEDSDISGTLIATDVEGLTDGNYFTVTLNPLQGAATIDASSGDWQYQPNADYFGADMFIVTVTDDAGATSTQVISLTVNSVNDVAQFSGDLNGTGDEDSDISGSLIATDVEGLSGDYFAISVNSLQGTATINQATGEWQYSPNANYFGADQFTLTVTDDLGGISSQLIDISVTAINDAPTITSAEITAATENQLYSYTVTTNDLEEDTVSLRANNTPGWLSFDESTGVLTGIPLHVHVGENTVEIEADDGTVTVSHIFTIIVADVNNLPTIELTVNNFVEDAGGLVANMSEAASYVVEDLDGDELTVTFEEGTNSNNQYVLDTAQQKILLTQVAIDTINSGNPLDTISLRVTDNYTSQPSTPDESPGSEFDSEFPDESLFGVIDGISGVGQGNTFEDSSSSDSNIDEGSSGSSDAADSETTTSSSFASTFATPGLTQQNDLPQGTVTINGSIEQGQTLTTSHNLSDQEGLGPISYQWQANSENIVDANESTYELTQDEVGKVITVRASYTDNQGNDESVSSAPTTAVTNINDAPQGKVTISGTVTQGQLLTAGNNLSDIDGLGAISYQWQAGTEDVEGANKSTYLLTQNEVDKTIRVIASYTDNQDTAESEASEPSSTVANINDAPVGDVTIGGTVAQDQILTASHTLTDADGLDAISYQWQANDENIQGAVQETYQLTQSDINKEIRVIASYTDNQGTDESVVSSNSSTQILKSALSHLAEDTKNNTANLYMAAGITGITEANIGSINDALDSEVSDILDAVSVEDQLQIQQLVISYTNILDFAFDDTTVNNPPVIEDYSNIGIAGLSDDITVISLLSDVIALGDKEAVDTVTKLQALVNAALSAIEQTENLSKDQLELMGIEAVTNDHLPTIQQIIASDPQAMDKVEKIQAVANKVVSSHIIQAYSADSANSPLPVLTDYENLGLTNIVVSNIDRVNIVIVEQDPSAIDTIEKITALLTLDTDGDTVEDVFDSFPNDANETTDSDTDNIGDNGDNCPNVANTNQADFDSDLSGDACDPDEDNDGVASAEDAFKLNPNYSSDTDGDGMPDKFETEYGFDINNSSYKDTDSDGDGVSNLDEFLADTDPRVNPNPGLPQLNIPDDIVITSTGRLTAVNLGEATAKDNSQVAIQPTSSAASPFSSGRHEITWSATDTQGNKSKAVQVVKVIPLANLTPSSISVEDSEIEVTVMISGNAADYPVEIPYTISGSATRGVDYRVLDDTGLLTIEKGREGSFTIEILPDEELENDETIEITINQLSNAELGSVTQQEISIVDGNLPPKILVQVEQAGNLGRVIASDKGRVTLTALISDPNPSDTLSFSWLSSIADLVDIERSLDNSGNNIFVFDPSQLPPNVYTVIAKARDDGNPSSLTQVTTDLRLMQAAPILSIDVDSDNDGVSDAEEGYGDSDNDGIINYKDNIVESNLMPISDDLTIVLQSQVGTKIVLGEVAFSNAEDTAMVTKQQVINVITELQLSNSNHILDKEYSYPFGLYDFTVSGAIAGDSYYLSLPLEVPFKEGQVLRKYMGPHIGWQNFIENAKNSLFSASAINGACPEPGSQLYDSGIKPGDTCIQLFIEDGGPNDFDGVADGIVTDPSGIAVYTNMGSTPSAEYSSLEINRKELTVGEKAIITIKAMGEDGSPIKGVNVTATCNYCRGVTIGPISEQGQGIYTAIVSTTKWYSNSSIEVEISNEFGTAKLGPVGLLVKLKKRGGCSIVQGQPADITLFVFLVLLTLFNYRQRRN